ncbi:ATP-dependent DNA helicase [Frankliniella fusca]|uniref:ATP-dependent DNA helicase n=1 Tax=Frankliniella fusca TaxID=407009 RepID=A0AAE1H0W6_9NEOP|nr:ATP-dependent DNA helicase [Frankliniella fusca]
MNLQYHKCTRTCKKKCKRFNYPLNFPLPNLIPETEFLALINSLNEKQRKYLLNLANLVKTNPSEQFFHFISGGAGVGKSTLINAIKQVLERFWMHQPNSKPEDSRILPVAPTGKAATGINGTTIDSAFGLGFNVKDKLRIGRVLNSDNRNTLACILSKLKLIILDEISMCNFYKFQAMNSVLQEIFENYKPFGGISVITVGDLNQLPPPVGVYVFKTPSGDFSRLLGLWQYFKLYELTEIMRRTGDIAFANALNNLSLGKTTEKQDNMFISRQLNILGEELTDIYHNAITLYYKNVDVDHFNNIFIAESPNETIISQALDSCSGPGSKNAKHYMLTTAKTLQHKKTQNLQYQLKLCTETKYIVCQNIAVPDGISNGSPCVLKAVIMGTLLQRGENTGQKIPIRAYVQFPNPATGQKRRDRLRDIIRKDGIKDHTWTPIERISRSFTISASSQIQLLYTAISRVTSLQGLYIAGTYTRPNEATLENDPSLKEMCRMRLDSPLQLMLTFPEDVKSSTNTMIIFQNVRSLHLHFTNVSNDRSFLSCDVIMLAETWSLPEDKYDINNYTIIFRTDCKLVKRKAFGTIIYVNNNILPYCRIIFQNETGNTEKHHSTVVAIQLHHSCIMMVYKSPKAPWSLLQQQMEHALQVCYSEKISEISIMGDFKIKYQQSEPSYNLLYRFMQTKSLFMLLDPTKISTDHNSLIDLSLSTNNSLRSDIFESVISDHKPIWLELV